MAKYAKIEKELVTDVVVSESTDFLPQGDWVNISKATAGIGYTYKGGLFIPPKPSKGAAYDSKTNSWITNKDYPEYK